MRVASRFMRVIQEEVDSVHGSCSVTMSHHSPGWVAELYDRSQNLLYSSAGGRAGEGLWNKDDALKELALRIMNKETICGGRDTIPSNDVNYAES